MERKLVYYPDPVLRTKAHFHNGEPSQEILDLIADLKDTCNGRNGLGLAAQQIGSTLPAMVFGVPDDDGEVKLIGVMNPKVEESGQVIRSYEEGCLSFPGLYMDIQRPNRITVSGWFDDVGQFETRTLTNLMARVFMHETDHLNGITFIDHVDTADRQAIKDELKRIARIGKKQAKPNGD